MYVKGQVSLQTNALQSSATLTRAATNTPYTAKDVVGTDPATNIEFANFGISGQKFIITSATMLCGVNAVPSGMGAFRLHLFTSAPTAIADNAAFNLIAADRSKYLGYIEFDTPEDMGDTLWSQKENMTKNGQLITTSLFGQLETVGAWTPSSAAIKTLSIFGVSA